MNVMRVDRRQLALAWTLLLLALGCGVASAGPSLDRRSAFASDCELAVLSAAYACEQTWLVAEGDACAVGCITAAGATGAFLSDDFNTCALSGIWTVTRPKSAGAVATTGGGSGDAAARFTLPAGTAHDAWGPTGGINGALRILQSASNVDFEILAKFVAEPTGSYNDQGIVVEQNGTNWLRFDVYHDGSKLYVFVGKTVNGVHAVVAGPLVLPAGSGTYLRLRRIGAQWTAFRSSNGSAWEQVATFAQNFSVTGVGVFAANVGGAAQTVDLDYFFETVSPIDPEDGAAPCDDGDTCTDDGCDDGDCSHSPNYDTATQCCDPATGTTTPAAPETCNGVDDDCDGDVDEDCPCGNGDLDDASEECDDGDNVDGDGCSATCQIEAECGNGIVEGDEACDDGNGSDADGCVAGCVAATCGDGYVRAGVESCDDGNAASGDACPANCSIAACGNKVVDPGEECDDGDREAGDGCESDCELTNYVANGEFSRSTPWKFFTDGAGTFTTRPGLARVVVTTPGSRAQLYQVLANLESNSRYRLRLRARNDLGEDMRIRVFDHVAPYVLRGLDQRVDLTPALSPFEFEFFTGPGLAAPVRLTFALDLGSAGSRFELDDVRLERVFPNCGDGSVDAGELCDDGNRESGDGCRADCLIESCGDAVLDQGESCDDGNLEPGDGCEADCTLTNFIANGGFASTAPWRFFTNGAGSYALLNGGARVDITTQGDRAQLYQLVTTLTADTRYRLRFRALNSLGNDAAVRLFQHASPFAPWGLGETFDLASKAKSFAFEFTTPSSPPPLLRLMFALDRGAAGSRFWFDDVALERVFPVVGATTYPSAGVTEMQAEGSARSR